MCDATVLATAKPVLLREMGEYTARIHAITGDRFGWPTANGAIRGSNRWSEVIQGLFDEIGKRCVDARLMSQTAAAALLHKVTASHALFDACTEPRLVHNDLWEPNVLVANQGDEYVIAGIIDVDRAMFADREFDFVLWSQNPHCKAGYGMSLDPAPEATFRRQLFYALCMFLFCTWAYGVQINKPDLLARCKAEMETELTRVLEVP